MKGFEASVLTMFLFIMLLAYFALYVSFSRRMKPVRAAICTSLVILVILGCLGIDFYILATL